MHDRIHRLRCAACALLLALPLAAARTQPLPPPDCRGPVGSLRLIGEQRIARGEVFEGTVVGGLSGLDYDARGKAWLLASDARSGAVVPRVYTARLDYDAHAFSAVRLRAVTRLARPDGAPYPSRPWDGSTPDVESLRIDPRDGSLWYASEGDGLLGVDPAIVHAARGGRALGALPLPVPLRMPLPGGARGPRGNKAFEGLAFAPDGQSLWAAMEAPLRQDGPAASPSAGALVRLTRFGRNGAVLRQVAYPLDAVPAQPGPGRAAENGVTEILASGPDRLLVLERSAVQDAAGRYANTARIYEADVSAASETAGLDTLAGAALRPAAKRRVLALPAPGLPRADNLEGMAWGPCLPGGHASLVLVSDDNFNPDQVTQLLAFEVLPPR